MGYYANLLASINDDFEEVVRNRRIDQSFDDVMICLFAMYGLEQTVYTKIKQRVQEIIQQSIYYNVGTNTEEDLHLLTGERLEQSLTKACIEDYIIQNPLKIRGRMPTNSKRQVITTLRDSNILDGFYKTKNGQKIKIGDLTTNEKLTMVDYLIFFNIVSIGLANTKGRNHFFSVNQVAKLLLNTSKLKLEDNAGTINGIKQSIEKLKRITINELDISELKKYVDMSYFEGATRVFNIKLIDLIECEYELNGKIVRGYFFKDEPHFHKLMSDKGINRLCHIPADYIPPKFTKKLHNIALLCNLYIRCTSAEIRRINVPKTYAMITGNNFEDLIARDKQQFTNNIELILNHFKSQKTDFNLIDFSATKNGQGQLSYTLKIDS